MPRPDPNEDEAYMYPVSSVFADVTALIFDNFLMS
jgi:hypothetical protein